MNIAEAWSKATAKASALEHILKDNKDDITTANAFKELMDVLEIIGRADRDAITMFAYIDTARKLMLKGVKNARKIAIETVHGVLEDSLEKFANSPP